MKPQRAPKKSRAIYSSVLLLALGLIMSSCSWTSTNQYEVTTGTDLYITVHGPYSAALALIGISCNFDANCVRDTMNSKIQISGVGAAQWNSAVNDHPQDLANVMRAIRDNGGSVNTGGPCIQMFAGLFGNTGWNYVPLGVDECHN